MSKRNNRKNQGVILYEESEQFSYALDGQEGVDASG